jgi:hypothetical protein
VKVATVTATVTQHTWIVLVSQHGPAAPYGCQHCPATTTGAGRASAPADCPGWQ